MNAIMTNFGIEAEKARDTRKWEGLSEIDQAIRDNRLMEYRIKKSWADPLSRRLTVGAIVLITLGFFYLVGPRDASGDPQKLTTPSHGLHPPH